MRRPAVLLGMTLAACAPAHTPDTGPESQTVRVSSAATGSSSLSMMSSAPETRVDTLPVSVPVAWRAMPATYSQLEIPVSHYDAATNVMGNTGFKAYRKLGNTAMTRLVDCGRTQVGQNAENYEIFLTIETSLRPVPDDSSRTTVSTTVQARAKPMAFAGEYVPCRSKGLLEKQVGAGLRKLVTP